MFRGPRDGQDDEQDGGRHIRPAQEGVLASHPRDGREDDRLGTRELSDGVVYRHQQHSMNSQLCSCEYVIDEFAVLTHVDRHLVRPAVHYVVVIPPPQLAKRRQSRSPHPDLEMLIVRQGREGLVPVRVPLQPVGRDGIVRGDSRRAVGIVLGLAAPGDVSFGKGVGLSAGSAFRVEQLQVGKRV